MNAPVLVFSATMLLASRVLRRLNPREEKRTPVQAVPRKAA